MSQTWAQIRRDSPERFDKIRKERRAYEREMKGTYAQHQADELARINLNNATELNKQRLANAGQLAAQKVQAGATTGAAHIRADASNYNIDTQIGEQARQWDSGAALRGEELTQAGLNTEGKRLALLYTPEMLEQQAAVGRSRENPAIPGSTLGANNPVDYSESLKLWWERDAEKRKKRNAATSRLAFQSIP